MLLSNHAMVFVNVSFLHIGLPLICMQYCNVFRVELFRSRRTCSSLKKTVGL